MLTYTMSDDGKHAVINRCNGANVRLSIIRLSRQIGREVPAPTLEEGTSYAELEELNRALLIERSKRRIEAMREERARTRSRQAAAEQALSPAAAERVAALRAEAGRLRITAAHADRNADMAADLAAAGRLDAKANAIIAGATTD